MFRFSISTPLSRRQQQLEKNEIPKKSIEIQKKTSDEISSIVTEIPSNLKGIFVSIPSYRDPQIVETVQDCISKARYPNRIYIGVCEQNIQGKDPTCSSLVDLVEKKQILVDSIPFNEARGPCYARERIETFLLPEAKKMSSSRGEEIKYVLCIDAHTLFQKNWDEIIETEFEKEKKRTGEVMSEDNFFFTGYPPQYNHNKYTNKRSWRSCANNKNVFMRTTRFISNGSPLYLNRHLFNATRPTYCIGLSAGFIFAPVEMIETVPYLKNVPFSFLGEETAMMLRYFTHGYIPKTCPFQVVQTTYNRSSRPSFLSHLTRAQKGSIRYQSNQKIRDLLQGKETDIGKIGNVKTVEEFEKFVGINFKRGVINIMSQCGISSYDTKEDLIIKYGLDNLNAVIRHCRIKTNKYRPLISF